MAAHPQHALRITHNTTTSRHRARRITLSHCHTGDCRDRGCRETFHGWYCSGPLRSSTCQGGGATIDRRKLCCRLPNFDSTAPQWRHRSKIGLLQLRWVGAFLFKDNDSKYHYDNQKGPTEYRSYLIHLIVPHLHPPWQRSLQFVFVWQQWQESTCSLGGTLLSSHRMRGGWRRKGRINRINRDIIALQELDVLWSANVEHLQEDLELNCSKLFLAAVQRV